LQAHEAIKQLHAMAAAQQKDLEKNQPPGRKIHWKLT
jgi:hypothetical protein